jgi:hypothetical protein
MADERDRDEAAGGEPPTRHAYPHDLAAAALAALRRRGDAVVASPLLEPALLESLLSTAYQASLLRDEGRQVIFRLVVAPPEVFPADGGPPSGLLTLHFPERRVCDVTELRRLAAAAPYHRALIGACIGDQGRPALWGVVHAGARWLRVQTGGRVSAPALPRALVVSVGGPGRIEVELGDTALARLEAGRIGGTTVDVFTSRWLPRQFAPTRAALMADHAVAKQKADARWAPLDESLLRGIGQHMVRQLIAVIRAARHGATLLVVPPEAEARLLAPDSILRVHYRLVHDEARDRYRSLMLRIMNRLAALHAGPLAEAVGWPEYQHSRDEEIAALDEALFEVAHLIAGFAAVDGAVLVTRSFEILGVGAEIVGNLPDVPTVYRADDLEGTLRTAEATERTGTRHRSAYRLCQAMKDALAVVVSQDGGVRFACWQDDAVTYWHYLSGHLLAA